MFWWVGLGEGGALGWNFSGAAGAVLRWFFGWWFEFAARLSFLVWFLHRGKNAELGLWFEMFHMFIHICIYVFFSGICI